MRQRAVVFARDVLVGLQVQTKFTGQVTLVLQTQEHTALPLAGFKNAALLIPSATIIHQWADDRDQQVAINAVA